MFSKFANYVKKNKLGFTATIISLVFMSFGLLAQIWKIWRTHDIGGISPLMFSLLAIQSLFWMAYGKQRRDLFIIVPNLFGSFFATIVVVEYFIFHP